MEEKTSIESKKKKIMIHRCVAAPKTSVRRCRNKAKNSTPYCNIHGKLRKGAQPTVIYHYDGSAYEYSGSYDDSRQVAKADPYWIQLNKRISGAKNEKIKKQYENQAKLLRNGTANALISELVNLKVVFDTDTALELLDDGLSKRKGSLSKEAIDNARKFLGKIYRLMENPDIIIKLQGLFRGVLERRRTKVNLNIIRTRVKYRPVVDEIIRIQRWYRWRKWLRNLVVSPEDMRKRFLPHMDKIILLQREIKRFVRVKVQHSHGCPYSCTHYTDIERKYRVVYKYQEGNTFHWRYYDIRWLLEDWYNQTNEKRFIVEAATRKELPDDFIDMMSVKMWEMTRLHHEYLRDESEDEEKASQVVAYNKYRDYKEEIQRRSRFGYNMLLLDLLEECGFWEHYSKKSKEIDSISFFTSLPKPISTMITSYDPPKRFIPQWRHQPNARAKFYYLYAEIIPHAYEYIRSTEEYNLEDYLFYQTRDFIHTRFFLDHRNYDEVCGYCLHILSQLLMRSKGNELYVIMKDLVVNGLLTVFG
jgi:hypothetical protein